MGSSGNNPNPPFMRGFGTADVTGGSCNGPAVTSSIVDYAVPRQASHNDGDWELTPSALVIVQPPDRALDAVDVFAHARRAHVPPFIGGHRS